jgi:hypothetical protein
LNPETFRLSPEASSLDRKLSGRVRKRSSRTWNHPIESGVIQLNPEAIQMNGKASGSTEKRSLSSWMAQDPADEDYPDRQD